MRILVLALGLFTLVGCSQNSSPLLRKSTLLRDGWKFVRQDEPSAQAVAFDDANWETVSLPHTWNVDDGADGGNNYYRGPGWYRVRLPVESINPNKRYYLRFGAASLVADVYVNGTKIGHHAGGFTAFCFDITEQLRANDNVLVVRVDNSLNPDVAPLSGDFTIYGGLYRDVELLELNPISISPIDDGSWGVYLKPIAVDAASAQIEVTVKLRNTSSRGGDAKVVCSVLDPQKNVVATQEVVINISANKDSDATLKLSIAHPHFWDGRRDPYCYAADVKLFENGNLVDEVLQPLGVRSFKVAEGAGLVLNGKPYDFHGVNYHQGRPALGWADTLEDKKHDLQLIADLGCTGVRLAHYPHADADVALCDEHGLVVWAELPLVNKLTDSDTFRENARQQLRELIKQQMNHPSILFWSIYNEPAINNEADATLWKFADELTALAHQLDPSRPTTGAYNMSPTEKVVSAVDLPSFNRYWGWYEKGTGDFAAKLDQTHDALKGKSFGISEYGAGASVKQHEIDPKQPQTDGKWHPQEWQMRVHEEMWNAMSPRPWIWCKLLWVMYDFPSDSRHEGDREGINDKGLVAADHKTLKDTYFFYQANWSDKPMVHIASRGFTEQPPGKRAIKVYTNCRGAKLFINGSEVQSTGTIKGICEFKGISFEPGKMSVRVEGLCEGRPVTDQCEWTILPAQR